MLFHPSPTLLFSLSPDTLALTLALTSTHLHLSPAASPGMDTIYTACLCSHSTPQRERGSMEPALSNVTTCTTCIHPVTNNAKLFSAFFFILLRPSHVKQSGRNSSSSCRLIYSAVSPQGNLSSEQALELATICWDHAGGKHRS
jgi:hypothetical protein